MKSVTKFTATTLSAAALFGILSLTPAAVAVAANPAGTVAAITVDTPRSEPAPGSTGTDTELMSTTAYHQGFTITNLSHYKLVLTSINHQYVDDQMPKIGTVVQPGEAIGFQIAWRFGWTQRPSPVFQVIGDDGSVIGDYVPVLQVNEWNTPSSYIHTIPAVLAHTEGGNTLTVTDPAGTVIDIPAREGATQAKVLTELCGNSAVECTFTPTGQQKTAGPRHTVFETYNNSSMENLSVGEWSENVSVTQSLELTASVQASILDIVEFGFSATYGHSWTTDHAFARTEQMNLQPYYYGRIEASQPLIQTTGDFTLKINNATVIVRGVVFTTPDPVRKTIVWKSDRPMTELERATAPDGESTPTPGATLRTVPATR